MALTPVPGLKVLDANVLSANMIVPVMAGPQSSGTTLANLAQYMGIQGRSEPANTAITTAGAGTLTAAALLGGVITRSGSVAAYTDTTATAAQIATALGSDQPYPTSWFVYIKNTVAFAETLAGGTGVVLSGQTIIPPNSAGMFLLTMTSATAATMVGVSVVPLTSTNLLASTTLSTVGAGTITAAGIAGAVTTRTGSQSNTAFTDTTDTADNIIAALPNANIGQSFIYRYRNNTDATATITGGSGVTVSGIAAAPPNTTVEFLVTYTAASTMTMVGISRTVPSTTSGTFVANGATPVTVTNSIVTANSNIIVTLKTVGGTVSPTRPNVLTITPGTGFTVGGVALDTSTYNYLVIN